jgi:hypothetical protein
MDVWIDVWLERWMNGRQAGLLAVWIDECVPGWMAE